MTGKIYLFATCVLVSLSLARCLQTVNGRIKITTVTTSACSDTVNFFRDHLVPTYDLYGEFLDLEFIPWGRTINHDNGTITCQFGVNDCYANRLHRCVLNMLQGDQKAQLDYLACELAPPYPALAQGSFSCVRAAGVRIVEADYCVNNPERDTLDQEAEEAAAEPMEIIDFVPSVVFNGVSSRAVSDEAQERLASMICFALSEDPTTGVVSCQI